MHPTLSHLLTGQLALLLVLLPVLLLLLLLLLLVLLPGVLVPTL